MMRTLVSLLAVAFLGGASVCASAQAGTPSFDQLLTGAKAAQSQNDFVTAAADYRAATSLDGTVPELWANLGLMQYLSADYMSAAASLERALALKPTLFTPILFLGKSYLAMQQPARATPYLRRAEVMHPTDAQIPLALGDAYVAAKDYAAATDAYTRATDLDNRNAPAWFGLGSAHLAQVEAEARRLSSDKGPSPWRDALLADSLTEQARYMEAAAIYQRLLATTDGPPCLRAALGNVSLRSGRVNDARAAFNQQISTDPGCSTAWLGLADADILGGNSEGALGILERLSSNDAGFLREHFASAMSELPSSSLRQFSAAVEARHASGQMDQGAYQVLQNALAGSAPGRPAPAKPVVPHLRKSPSAWRASGQFSQCVNSLWPERATLGEKDLQLLAECAHMTGNNRIASMSASQLIRRFPESGAGFYWAIRAHEWQAVTALAHFEELAPDSAQTHLLLADLYRHKGKLADAAAEYQKALAIAPSDHGALLGAAATDLMAGRTDDAIATALRGLAQQPGDARLNLLVAEALAAQNKYTEAEPYLLASLHGDPELLPRVHALLGRSYAASGRTEDAIAQLKLGVASDEDGSVHYQLARLYGKIGNKKESTAAMDQARQLEQERRARAVVAVSDSRQEPPSP